jgi:hypothetical protein
MLEMTNDKREGERSITKEEVEERWKRMSCLRLG